MSEHRLLSSAALSVGTKESGGADRRIALGERPRSPGRLVVLPGLSKDREPRSIVGNPDAATPLTMPLIGEGDRIVGPALGELGKVTSQTAEGAVGWREACCTDVFGGTCHMRRFRVGSVVIAYQRFVLAPSGLGRAD